MLYAELPFDSRVGKWMFICATALSLSDNVKLYTQHDSVASLFENYKSIFKNIELVRTLPDDIIVIKERNFTYESIHIENFENNYLLRGYFQSEKYFDEEKVREFFKPSLELIKNLKNKYKDIINKQNVSGISVRRGNYLKLSFILPFCGKQYYRDCIARNNHIKYYIVCSDDMVWCKKFFTSNEFPDKRFYFMEGASVIEQLYIHTLCNTIIMSNSSFSWWSAWLNDNPQKRIFMPSMWLGFSMKGVDWSSIYISGAEIVKNKYTLSLLLKSYYYFYLRNFKIRFYPIYKKIIFWK